MAQTIKLKRSAQSGASGIPSTSDLALGEVAINTYHGKMYIKKDDGTESIVEVGSTGSFLPLSGGSLTGNLALGTNSLSANSITLNASGSSNPQITFNNNDFTGTDAYDWFLYQDDSGKLVATVTGTGGAEMQLYSAGTTYTNATLHVGGARVITANEGVAMR